MTPWRRFIIGLALHAPPLTWRPGKTDDAIRPIVPGYLARISGRPVVDSHRDGRLGGSPDVPLQRASTASVPVKTLAGRSLLKSKILHQAPARESTQPVATLGRRAATTPARAGTGTLSPGPQVRA